MASRKTLVAAVGRIAASQPSTKLGLFMLSRSTAARTPITALRAPSMQCRLTIQQRRWNSGASGPIRDYFFDDIKSFSATPSQERILIDVREPSEYEGGYIPGAINVPVGSSPDALFMPADEFEDKFGFAKPKHDQEVIFYCKAGVRSNTAAKLAQQVGYGKIGQYRGSWLDWVKNDGETAK